MMVDLVDSRQEKQIDGQRYIDGEGFIFPVFRAVAMQPVFMASHPSHPLCLSTGQLHCLWISRQHQRINIAGRHRGNPAGILKRGRQYPSKIGFLDFT